MQEEEIPYGGAHAKETIGYLDDFIVLILSQVVSNISEKTKITGLSSRIIFAEILSPAFRKYFLLFFSIYCLSNEIIVS